ncbi:MAG TPA: sterol desaturase family protein [Candidatus Binataceae bacterium]|nr:sterol desaturase family protein [Candidatus Binataceae bacterium]
MTLGNELTFEALVRLAFFIVVFAAMAIAEASAPRRARALDRAARWPGNLAIAAINTALVRVLIPATAVGAAMVARRHEIGVLNWLALPRGVALVVAVAALDLAIYLQHVMFHAVPILWRVHRMHHTDLDIDVTTGLRFHPIETILSMLIKIGAVIAIGAPPVAVLAFEVLLNANSMFNHGNLAISERTDRWLRWIVVTPDMHRVHHSIVRDETNSNFGFNLPWWDRMMGTYRAEPAAGQIAMTIGIDQFRSPQESGLMRMLTQPVREDAGQYPLGRDS